MPDILFAGKSVLAVGELNHLPPVNATPVYASSKSGEPESYVADELWKMFRLIELTEVMRQKGVTMIRQVTACPKSYPKYHNNRNLLSKPYCSKFIVKVSKVSTLRPPGFSGLMLKRLCYQIPNETELSRGTDAKVKANSDVKVKVNSKSSNESWILANSPLPFWSTPCVILGMRLMFKANQYLVIVD